MATFYVDSRAAAGGDGSASLPFNTIQAAAAVASGSVVEFVEGSGPYSVVSSTFQPANTSVTWNFNNCWVRGDVDLGASSWLPSATSGYYYLETPGTLVQPRSVVVDGIWNCESMNLAAATPSGFENNWRWGNLDALAANTLYVRWHNGEDFRPERISIWAAQQETPIKIVVGKTGHLFNDMRVSGSNGASASLVYLRHKTNMRNCLFYNSNWAGIQYAPATGVECDDMVIAHSQFIACGHKANRISAKVTNLQLLNNTLSLVHVAVEVDTINNPSVVYKNNIAFNMYAGILEDNGNPCGFIEDFNAFHIDPSSPHGGKVFAFEGSATWTTTGSNSLPSATATSSSNGVDPLLVSSDDYHLQSTSPAIGAGTDVGLRGYDLAGQPVMRGRKVNIGAYSDYLGMREN